jgi:magnesium-transporting ATPase (P-type)
MITGDYHHTAVAVARDVGMVKPDGRVVVIDTAHTEVLRDDQSAAQTPDAGGSAAGSPLSTPQVSFQRRNADFAHGFFAQSSKPGPGVSVVEALPAKRASVEKAQPSRVSWEGQQPSRLSWEEQQPSRLSVEGLNKNDLPFTAASTPQQPIEDANVHMLPAEAVPAERPPKTRLSFEGMPSANKAAAAHKIRLPPMKAAQSQAQGPIQAAHSAAQVPIEASLHSSPSRRQLVKAASLASLPSQTAVSMAAAPAEASSQHTSSSKPASQGLAELGHRMLQVSVSKINRAFAPTWDSADGPMSDPYDSQRAPLKGLVFTSGTGSHYVMEPCEAISSMAEGSMQSAVTGDALEYMLRMRDMSLLEAVMRNAVVFSRMQPHQKGQVMDLLGSRGIHQRFEGQPRYIQVGKPS